MSFDTSTWDNRCNASVTFAIQRWANWLRVPIVVLPSNEASLQGGSHWNPTYMGVVWKIMENTEMHIDYSSQHLAAITQCRQNCSLLTKFPGSAYFSKQEKQAPLVKIAKDRPAIATHFSAIDHHVCRCCKSSLCPISNTWQCFLCVIFTPYWILLNI